MDTTLPDVSVLTEHECWALLRKATTGRLAVLHEDRPEIFPLTFTVDHGSVVFRTSYGTKMTALRASPQVAFEVDGHDADTDEAWSVVLKGEAEPITSLHDELDALTLPLAPAQPGPKHHFVRIVPSEITGRRFTVISAEAWRNPLTDVAAQAPE